VLVLAKIEQKQVVVSEIKEKLEKATSAVLVDARGLTVEQDTALRKQLRDAGVDYKVYKNTMMNFAVKDTQFEGLKDFFEGPSAIAICYEDPTVAAGIMSKFMKDAKNLEFKAGVIDGVCYDAKGMAAVAEIPSREVLLSKLLGSFQSPMATFARVIKAIADKDTEAAEA
jgi:large subunit ribosomal protein L10